MLMLMLMVGLQQLIIIFSVFPLYNISRFSEREQKQSRSSHLQLQRKLPHLVLNNNNSNKNKKPVNNNKGKRIVC